ncbi:MAG TPA: ABC transporter ATP-binding protein [Polyangiaceae bacterium]|nr:ABC transporter ATP-binding protein [Polyangiaceae bacterium]HMR73707.1 ABC transporter ATP-binding protein [Polyangiaceae bacterium]
MASSHGASPPAETIPVTLTAQFLRQAPRYGVGLLLLAAYQYAQYWFDTRLMTAINDAMAERYAEATRIGGYLVLVALGAFGVRVMSRVALFNGGRIAEYELRRALLYRLHKLGPSFYRRMSSGEIMSRVTNDLAQVRLLLGFGVLNVINTLFALISALSVTLSISWKLTLASLSMLPVLMLVTQRFSRLIYTRTRDNQDAIGKMSESVQSSIAGVRVVRSFALEDAELERFEKTNQLYLDKSLALARLRGSMGPIMQAIVSVGILIVFWYGGHLMLHDELSAGGFLAFYRALARLTWPLIALGFLVGLVQRGRASYARLEEIYQAEPDIVDGPKSSTVVGRGALEVRGLSFAHGDQKVLDDVSFEVPAGGSLAIVGRTGSGKSTLAVLLPRLMPTPAGAVFLDGEDICDLPLETVRSAVGYAQQTAFLFSTTIGRNIGYVLDEPDSEPSLKTIREAAREAHVLDEVMALPDRFDTIVGERGVQLSGGQKQRTALARAFVAQPKIMVLDDPLSAVDARTERAILDAIDRQRAQRGVILITHRVAAAARCDRVLVLDEGRVVEQGSHDELIAKGGIYAVFAEEQRIEQELAKLGERDLNEIAQSA